MSKLLKIQSIILLSGTLFAFYTVYTDFVRYFLAGGLLLKFSGCPVTNPLATPCFYGAFAFLFSFLLSLTIVSTKDLGSRAKKQTTLFYILIGSTLFAWGNFLLTVYNYIEAEITKTTYIGCSGVPKVNPLYTPCFVGASIFLIALILGDRLVKAHKTNQSAA